MTSQEDGGQIGQTEAEGEEEEEEEEKGTSQWRRGRRSEAELIHRFDFINRDGADRKRMLIWQSQKDKKIFMNEATSKKTGRHLGASERDSVRFSLFAP